MVLERGQWQGIPLKCKMRIGHGYDVHRYDFSKTAKPLKLAGVRVDADADADADADSDSDSNLGFGVMAHSDGDVLYHAMVDAILGALGERDIGFHFSDADSTNENRNSMDFLKFAFQLMYKYHFELVNCDITIVAQAPKLLNHIQEMRVNIQNVCNLHLHEIPLSCINVKATTTEGLGFIGRKEGIAAYAVVLLEKTE